MPTASNAKIAALSHETAPRKGRIAVAKAATNVTTDDQIYSFVTDDMIILLIDNGVLHTVPLTGRSLYELGSGGNAGKKLL